MYETFAGDERRRLTGGTCALGGRVLCLADATVPCLADAACMHAGVFIKQLLYNVHQALKTDPNPFADPSLLQSPDGQPDIKVRQRWGWSAGMHAECYCYLHARRCPPFSCISSLGTTPTWHRCWRPCRQTTSGARKRFTLACLSNLSCFHHACQACQPTIPAITTKHAMLTTVCPGRWPHRTLQPCSLSCTSARMARPTFR